MRRILIAAVVCSFFASAGLAQTMPPITAPSTPKANPKAPTATKIRSAESLECSKQADTQGLHGKARKTFRAKCKKDFRKKP